MTTTTTAATQPPGRPKTIINLQWLQGRVKEGKDDKEIVAELNESMGIQVSAKTIQRRRQEIGMCFFSLLFTCFCYCCCL